MCLQHLHVRVALVLRTIDLEVACINTIRMTVMRADTIVWRSKRDIGSGVSVCLCRIGGQYLVSTGHGRIGCEKHPVYRDGRNTIGLSGCLLAAYCGR